MTKRSDKRPALNPPFTRPTRPLSMLETQTIFCGDNIDVLPQLPSASVDLVYVDPPFNSNRVYETFWGETKERRAFEDRHDSTRAYIEYMRPRCAELARVLKPTGSFYYHCDWHAGHYAKVMLDEIFGESGFQNEIAWRRSTSPHNDPKRYGANHDTLFFYTGGGVEWTWHTQHLPLSEKYVQSTFRYQEADGRRYRLQELTASKPGGDVSYEWKGIRPPAGRYWAYSKENMRHFEDAGLIHYSGTGFPRYKQYLDESKGVPLQTFWDDIPNASGHERVGYPTQKPLALLDRILKASSDPDDIVLDAFCGCGTALVSAEQLDRRWIGIDSSPTACRVMADRLMEVCKLRQDKDFFVVGLPRNEEELRRMPPFEFQNWAVVALGGIPNRRKSGDKGVDGRFYPVASESKRDVKEEGFDFMKWYPVQVKQRDKAGRPDIDAFETAIQREGKRKGIFVSFGYTSDATREIADFFKRTGCVILALTVRHLMEVDATELAMKLA